MKKLLFVFLIMMLMSCLSCNRGSDQSKMAGKSRIALVLKTLNSPFFIDLRNGAEAAAKIAKIELIVQAPDREIDVEKQMQIIENLIQMKVDAICVSPSGSRELLPAISKANNAGIPVLIVDTGIDEEAARSEGIKTATFIGSDNYEGGKIAGTYLSQLYGGNANVAVLEGIPGHETADSRLRGFRDGISDYPNIEIVASQPANFERDQGYNVMQNMLQAHAEIQAVFACNDMMALGAMEAIASSGRTGSIKIIGFDAVAEARAEIERGNLEASVAQHPAEMGRLAIENAIKIINGKTVPAYIPVKIELIIRVNGINSSN